MATVRINLGGRDDAKICVKVISDFTDTLLYRLLPALLVLLFSTVTMDLTMGKLLLLFPSAVELCCDQTKIISCHIKHIDSSNESFGTQMRVQRRVQQQRAGRMQLLWWGRTFLLCWQVGFLCTPSLLCLFWKTAEDKLFAGFLTQIKLVLIY